MSRNASRHDRQDYEVALDTSGAEGHRRGSSSLTQVPSYGSSPSDSREPSMTVSPKPPTVLLVDDERDFREVVSLRLKQQGYDVLEAENAGSGWELAHTVRLQAAILDYRLPGIDGQSLAYQLRHEFGDDMLLLAFTAWPVGQLTRSDLFDSVHAKPNVDAVLSSLRPLWDHARGGGAARSAQLPDATAQQPAPLAAPLGLLVERRKAKRPPKGSDAAA